MSEPEQQKDGMKWRYAGDNRILLYFAVIRPQLWEAPEWEKCAFLVHHALEVGTSSWNDLLGALQELIPEWKEFWLRVEATWDTQFLEALTAMFEQPELSDEEVTIMAAAISVKNQKKAKGE